MTSPPIPIGGAAATSGTTPPPPPPPAGTGSAAASMAITAAATGAAAPPGAATGSAPGTLAITAAATGTSTSTAVDFALSPSAHGYPDATNTGATGTLSQLKAGTPASGSGWSWNGTLLTITGSLFANYQIPGTVSITAANVTMRNCHVITGGFDSNGITVGANGFLIDHCTVQGLDALSGGLDAGIKTAGGSRSFSGTIDSCNIFNTRSGIQDMAGTVKNTYIHDLRHASGDHINGLTQNGGSNPLLVQHNTIFCAFAQTDAVGLFGDFGREQNDTVTDNILAGGGYTIYGGNSSPGGDPANIVITNNRISSIFYPQGGFFGWIAATGSAGAGNVVSGNLWDHTGNVIAGQ